MTILINILIYIFEALISFLLFDNKFDKRIGKWQIFLVFSISVIAQFTINLIGIPLYNLISFIVFNFFICKICYQTKITQALFNTIILAVAMFITELVIVYFSKYIFGTGVMEHITNEFVFTIQSICSKLLYFLTIYLVSKLSTIESRQDLKTTKIIPLFLLPISSIIILHGIAQSAEKYIYDKNLYIMFIVSAILLMYANITVFFIHESLIKAQKENTELQLQTQKAEIDTEYYTILQNQYENSNILVHDIKRHLMSIKNLADENDCYSIENYIDNLYNEYEVKNIKQYSNNKLLNAIVNRYAAAYAENNIDFYCDIRNIDFSFITNNDLTVIIDNLLENALEANPKNDSGKVELFIFPANVNYITIKLINSCKSPPIIHNGKLITTKTKSSIHGYGLKSIKRIIKKYNGDMSFSFDKSEKLFTSSIILKTI